MILTPFDPFKVKWLNSHIFYELFGCRDIGMQVGNMYMNDDKREEETNLHQIWILSQPYFFWNVANEVWI